MSSGVGAFTKNGRCFPFFKDMLHCFNKAEYPDLDCRNQVEDYMECLHHKKEVIELCYLYFRTIVLLDGATKGIN